jgi:hypothetical protein
MEVTSMKKANILIIGIVIALALVTNVYTQTPPKPPQPPPATHVGDVVNMQGTTLIVTGGGKGGGGQMVFNTATATWEGYASSSEVKSGDYVKVTYQGTVGGLNKAIKVAKELRPIKKLQGNVSRRTGAR